MNLGVKIFMFDSLQEVMVQTPVKSLAYRIFQARKYFGDKDASGQTLYIQPPLLKKSDLTLYCVNSMLHGAHFICCDICPKEEEGCENDSIFIPESWQSFCF